MDTYALFAFPFADPVVVGVRPSIPVTWWSEVAVYPNEVVVSTPANDDTEWRDHYTPDLWLFRETSYRSFEVFILRTP